MHGHTYQAHPLCCAAALEVQRIIREQNLVDNVRRMGEVLSRMLAETLGNHPNVGNIRGRGLFWAIEFVVDKSTGRPFPPEDAVAMSVCVQGLTPEYAMAFYPATGTVNGKMGDFIIVSPPYTVTEEDIHLIVQTLTRLVSDFFAAKCMPA